MNDKAQGPYSLDACIRILKPPFSFKQLLLLAIPVVCLKILYICTGMCVYFKITWIRKLVFGRTAEPNNLTFAPIQGTQCLQQFWKENPGLQPLFNKASTSSGRPKINAYKSNTCQPGLIFVSVNSQTLAIMTNQMFTLLIKFGHYLGQIANFLIRHFSAARGVSLP